MSVIYKGRVLDTSLTINAKGGTEQMRGRILRNVNKDLLEKVAIHFSRPTSVFPDVPNILYFHDLPSDPAYSNLNELKTKFDYFVFVSCWQRDQFISKFSLPYSKCTVIHNAIEEVYFKRFKPKGIVNFIYHTTPHRGLELVYPIIDALKNHHENIHLNVYSSFSVYGWKERDRPYLDLFEKIQKHPNMTYHGAKTNEEVIEALRKSHIFLYPSIWKETSCIALIEAMTMGCFCIYPSYGALHETGSYTSNIGMYDYTEDSTENANRAAANAHYLLNKNKEDPSFIEDLVGSSVSNTKRHTISTFARSWDAILQKVVDN
jgi:UDP-glucose:(glucosyl)LPS alpha-1,2-glucosyltransferase